MFTISPNCSLDHLEQAASNAKTEKKIQKNGNKIFRQSIITDYCIDLIYCSWRCLPLWLTLTDFCYCILFLFLSSRNQGVRWICKVAVHSSIDAALSAHRSQCLWFLSDICDCISVFSPSLNFFWFVNHNVVVFVLSVMMFMHLTSACTFFNEIEAELSRKLSSYWLQNQLF